METRFDVSDSFASSTPACAAMHQYRRVRQSLVCQPDFSQLGVRKHATIADTYELDLESTGPIVGDQPSLDSWIEFEVVLVQQTDDRTNSVLSFQYPEPSVDR